MTIHAAKNSVAGQIEGRPLNMVRSIAGTTMTVVAKQVRDYASTRTPKMVRPEPDALAFYVLEHAAGVIRAKYGPHDALPPGELKILEDYNATSLRMATRAYYYLLLICWREMRHCATKPITYPAAGTHVGVDPAIMGTFLGLTSDTSDLDSIAAKWDKAGDITLGQLTSALVYGYRKGKWGSNYGGPKWAVVAECLDSFVWGRTSAAMMLDTVWTLAHNTAPIFNKGMLYSDQDKYDLLEILDVQRAGMIPQYILTATTRGYRAAEHISVPFTRSVALIGRTLGGVFADKSDVDWVQVEALGSKHKYSTYIQKLGQTPQAGATPKPESQPFGIKPYSPVFTPTPNESNVAQYAIKQLAPGVKVKLGREAA